MTIRVKPNLDILTIDDLLKIEGGKLTGIVEVYSKFVVGDNGEYLPPEEGAGQIRKLTIAQMHDLNVQIVGEMKAEVPQV